MIGVIERLLAGLAAAGSLQRWGSHRSERDLESRDFAEYFLVGTLASTAVALVAGARLRIAVTVLWSR